MVANTKYCIVFQNPGAGLDDSNYTKAGRDSSSPSHSGNSFTFKNSIWNAESSNDTPFYVYGEAVAGGLSIPVAMHHYGHHIGKIIRG